MEAPLQKPASSSKTYATIVAVLLALAIIAWAANLLPRFVARPAPILAVTIEERAWYACAAHIAEQFKFSFFDAQRYYPAGVTTISNDTYQASIAYPGRGSTILCKIQHTPSGTWQILELR